MFNKYPEQNYWFQILSLAPVPSICIIFLSKLSYLSKGQRYIVSFNTMAKIFHKTDVFLTFLIFCFLW